MGDPAGVGPEIIVKAFLDDSLNAVCRAVVIGDVDFLRPLAARFAPGLTLRRIASVDASSPQPGTLDVLDLKNVPGTLKKGVASPEGGQASVDCIEKAVRLALEHDVDAITTAPINKESLHLAGHPYPGHTELLAALTGAERSALMLAGPNLRVVLVTTHAALHAVPAMIDADRVASILRLTHRWLKTHVTEKPHIAVTGLNPHCGDGGVFGSEEQEAILPALEAVRREGIEVRGPFSADALFAQKPGNTYDAVVTMYHDQGMIPVKMDSMGSAVNITLGLPIIRTSVDHGTAYDIAGTGTASPESLKSAIREAARLSRTAAAAR